MTTPTNPSEGAPRRRLFDVETTAKFLGVTPRSVRNYISKGFFPAYRIPGTRGIRLDPDEVSRRLRLIPSKTARVGAGSFGPNAKIIDLPAQRQRPEIVVRDANGEIVQ